MHWTHLAVLFYGAIAGALIVLIWQGAMRRIDEKNDERDKR